MTADMFHLAIDASPVAMALIAPDGKIEVVNSELERMFGYVAGYLIGFEIEILVPKDVKPHHRELRDGFAREPSKRLMGVGRDLYAVRADGSEFAVEIGLTPVVRAKGLCVVVFIIDINTRREAEKAIGVYTKQLERANEGLARFAYVASHDIQEPLRKIVVFADMMKTAIEEMNLEDAIYASNVMQASARHARALVGDLLTFARSTNEEYMLESISLRPIVYNVLLSLSQAVRDKKAVVSMNVEDIHMKADRTQLTMLVQNLISNALKYHKDGESPVVAISTQSHRDGAQTFVIEDQGIGFAQSHGEEIFEPFKRLHSRDKYPGSGIGLAICKTIATRHGWSISALSEPMKGSRFEVNFGHALGGAELASA